MSATLGRRVKDRLRRVRRSAPAPETPEELRQLRRRVNQLARTVSRLTERIDELEEELTEARSQGRRIAEISLVVTDLLAHEASKQDPEFQRLVEKLSSERRG